MNNVFGVSSGVPANTRLKNGYTMYDWVMRKNCFPAFWGRTLIGDNPITKEEIDFLRDKDCKILLIDRDLTEAKVSSSNGKEDAQHAVCAAISLGVPRDENIAIFVELKSDWSVNHNWMLSFAKTIAAYGYVPGFIGNTDSSKNFNFDRQCSHYVYATQMDDHWKTVYCSTEPKNSAPVMWEPFCPSALSKEDMNLWMCDEIKFDEMTVDCIYAKNEKQLVFLW